MRWIKSREHSGPWFLVFEDGAWRLDLSVMQSAIRVGRGNAWRFADGPPARYRFAFADWRFDKNGFSHEKTTGSANPQARRCSAAESWLVSGVGLPLSSQGDPTVATVAAVAAVAEQPWKPLRRLLRRRGSGGLISINARRRRFWH